MASKQGLQIKIICRICQSNELESEINHTPGSQSKIWGSMVTSGPLRIATVHSN